MDSVILVGVDGSDGSGAALRWAAGIGRRMNGRVRALQAWEYPASAVVEVGRFELPDPDKVDEMVEEQLRAFVDDVLGSAAGAISIEVGRGGEPGRRG